MFVKSVPFSGPQPSPIQPLPERRFAAGGRHQYSAIYNNAGAGGYFGHIQETVTFETLADPARQIREIRKAMLRLKRAAGKDSAQSIRECG